MSAKYPVGTRLKCVGPIFSSFFEEYATVRMSQRHGLGVRFDSYEYNPDDQHSLEDFVWEVVTKPKPKGLVAFLRKHEEKT